MSKLTNQTCQQIEEQFLIDFQRFYDITKEDLVMNCKRKLLNEEYPLEFFQYLYRTKKLAKYAILLTKLPTDLYDVNSELIYNGLKWFTIAYSRNMNPYIHKRNKDKNVCAWIEVHREWDKYCKKHHPLINISNL